MNPRRVWLVTRQEFRVRLRTGRWRWLLGGWVVLLLLFTALLQNALNESYSYRSLAGVPLFGILMLFVLGMMLVISPALTAGAVNGERERGTLATLQVTPLRPGEIAVGKLLAGWAVGLVSLGLTLPFAGWAMLQGGVGVSRLVVVYLISALLMGVVCAISLAYSATLARTVTSTLLSYLTVGLLCIGTYIGFALVLPLTSSDETVTTPDGYTYTFSHTHQEDVWWILAPNPFVVLADSAPRVDPTITQNGDVIQVSDNDPLSALAREVRSLRRPNTSYQGSLQDDAYAVWPWGLGFDLLVGAGAVAITARRLRTPSRRLGRGIRVA
jgi:ABC-type transport system involved in multi-copper enzyme maturation permease subunit